jgi:hypothetical protein
VPAAQSGQADAELGFAFKHARTQANQILKNVAVRGSHRGFIRMKAAQNVLE